MPADCSRRGQEHAPDDVNQQQHGWDMGVIVAEPNVVPDRPIQCAAVFGQQGSLNHESHKEQAEDDEGQGAVDAQEDAERRELRLRVGSHCSCPSISMSQIVVLYD
jgi:hypothetical protein